MGRSARRNSRELIADNRGMQRLHIRHTPDLRAFRTRTGMGRIGLLDHRGEVTR